MTFTVPTVEFATTGSVDHGCSNLVGTGWDDNAGAFSPASDGEAERPTAAERAKGADAAAGSSIETQEAPPSTFPKPSLRAPRGRRRKTALETRVHKALSVQVFLAVERMGALTRREKGRRCTLTVPALREAMIDELAQRAWVPDPLSAGTLSSNPRRFLANRVDHGARLVSRWYPSRRARDLSLVIAEEVAAADASSVSAERADAFEEMAASVRFLLRALRRATALAVAEHEQAARQRKWGVKPQRLRKKAKGEANRADAAPIKRGPAGDDPCLVDAVRAALANDLNVSPLFPNLGSHTAMLTLACLLGRHARGHAVDLDQDACHALRDALALTKSGKTEPNLNDDVPHPAMAAAVLLTDTALVQCDRANWDAMLEAALAGGEPLRLARPLQRAA